MRVNDNTKHEWIVEVYSDLATYARKNDLLGILEHIAAALPILECAIGTTPKLEAFRQSISKDLLNASG